MDIVNTNNPKLVAEAIKNIIQVMTQRMKIESQFGATQNIKGRIHEINPMIVSQKKNPGGASIGVSISIVKNVLNGRDPYFIHSVLEELKRSL